MVDCWRSVQVILVVVVFAWRHFICLNKIRTYIRLRHTKKFSRNHQKKNLVKIQRMQEFFVELCDNLFQL